MPRMAFHGISANFVSRSLPNCPSSFAAFIADDDDVHADRVPSLSVFEEVRFRQAGNIVSAEMAASRTRRSPPPAGFVVQAHTGIASLQDLHAKV